MSSKEKTWKEISMAGVCSKSSVGFMTGDWKTYMPVRDLEKCTLCLTCVMLCPDGAIRWRPELGKIEIDNFQGFVIPEPSAVIMAALVSLPLLWVRRRPGHSQ